MAKKLIRTFGTLALWEGAQRVLDGAKGSHWVITCEPHVMIRLKALFPRIEKSDVGSVWLSNSNEVCADLEWFLIRYPLEMNKVVAKRLASGSAAHRSQVNELESIFVPDFQAREFPLAKPLRHYQTLAVELQMRTKSLLLCDQLGLGKTVTALGAHIFPETQPVLVVCQTHLCFQWRDFIAEFMPLAPSHIIKTGKPYDLPPAAFYIINYHKLATWADRFAAFVKSIVFDEIQELRHTGSKKYDAALGIRRTCDYAMGLSATPIYNYGGEIFNILEILSPGRIGSRDEFYREWCIFWGNNKWLLREPEAFGKYLRENFLMLRRTRIEVGRELPPLERIVQTIPYNPDVLNQIADVATELAHIILKGEFMERGQAARELDWKLRQATGIAKAPFVAEFVKMLVEDGQQVLLFGWHRAVYDVWMEKLRDFNPSLYTGTETGNQKAAAKASFQSGETKVLIMSLRAGSGLDGLQMNCNTAVFGEIDWSPGIHDQCIGRLNRDGSKGGVNAFFLLSDAGSDPVVAEVLGLKSAQLAAMIDPDKKDNLGGMQTDADRMKRMATAWLARRSGNADCGTRNEENTVTVISGLPSDAASARTGDFQLI